jgi:PAS domain S-box-containing protein
MDSPLDGMMLINPYGEVLDANPVMAAGLGKTLEEIIGTSTFDLFPPEVAQHRRGAVRQVLENGRALRFQGLGKTEIVDVTMYPVKDDHGLIFQIAIIARNISAQRRAEEELRNSNRTIMALMEAAIDVMFIIDPEGRIIYANQTLARVLGFSMEKSQGGNFLDLLPSQLVGFSMDQVNLVIKTGKHDRFQGEHAGRTFDFTLFPVKDDEGKTILLGVIGRDVTEIVP